MSNTLSLAMLIAAYAQETGEAVLALLTFTHPEWPTSYYFAINGENIVSRVRVYNACSADVLIPDDTTDRPPQANITFPNVDRQMTALLEASITPPTVLIEIILASDPDNVEIEFPDLQVQSGAKYNVQNVTGALCGWRTSREGFPKGIISPTYFPGAF